MLSRILRSLSVFALMAFAVLTPTIASAEPPQYLRSEITDLSGVLSGSDVKKVQVALDELAAKTDYQLFVVFIKSFDGVDPYDWAAQTAATSNFGRDDILLVVATEDRAYRVSVDNGIAFTDGQLSRVETQAIEPRLRSNDWAGAAVDAAEGYQSAAINEFPKYFLIGVAGVGAVGGSVFAASAFKRRRKLRKELSELNREASTLLVEADNSLGTSGYELGYAQAQFGAAQTAPFEETLAKAKETLLKAFALRQQLDDTVPETPAERRSMLNQIIKYANEVMDVINAQTKAFSDLRALHEKVPGLIEDQRVAVEAARSDSASMRVKVDAVSATYEVAALAPITELFDAAAERFDAALIKLQDAAAALDERAKAVVLYQEAEDLTRQGAELNASAVSSFEQLRAAPALIEAAVESIESDLRDAERLAGDQNKEVSSKVRAAARALDAAGSPQAARNPLKVLGTLRDAEVDLDRVLDPLREHEQNLIRAKRGLEAHLEPAEARAQSVAALISSNRSDVGSTARTRLSEGERLLSQARLSASDDPITAWKALEGALERLRSAESRAESDVRDAQASRRRAEAARLGAYSSGYSSSSYSSGWGGGSSRSSRSSSSYRSSSSSSSSSSRRGGGGSVSSSSRRGGGGRF